MAETPEVLHVRLIAAIVRIIELIHSVVRDASAWADLEDDFNRLREGLCGRDVATLSRLHAYLLDIDNESLRHDGGPCTAQLRYTDGTLKRLSTLLPEPRPTSEPHTDASEALREILAPAVIRAMHERMHLNDERGAPSSESCMAHCSNGVLTFDRSGFCIFRNHAAARILRLTSPPGQPFDPRVLPRPLRAIVERFRTREWTAEESLPITVFEIGHQVIECLPQVRVSTKSEQPVLHLLIQAEAESDKLVDRLTLSATLSPRETAVARAVVEGQSAAAIAAKMRLSPHTVRTYIERVYQKLNVRSRHELMKLLTSVARHPEFN